MMSIQETIAQARKIVIKIGSNTLAKADGTINYPFMQDLARQILHKRIVYRAISFCQRV